MVDPWHDDKPGDCIHCGKEICNDLGWCNSFKAAPAAGVGGNDHQVVGGQPPMVSKEENE